MHLVYYHTRTAPATASPLVEYYGGEVKWGPYVLYGGLFLGILLLIGVFLWSRRHATDPPRNESEFTPATTERLKDNVSPNTIQDLTDNDLLPKKVTPSLTTASSSSSQNQGAAMSTTVVTTGPRKTKKRQGNALTKQSTRSQGNALTNQSTRSRRRIMKKKKNRKH